MPSLTLGLDFGGSTLKAAWIRDGAVLTSGVIPNRGEPVDLDAVVRLADDLRPDGRQPDDQQARENLQKALRELMQQQNSSSQQKQSSSMDQNEADQKLKLLQQKERQIQQRIRKNSQGGGAQSRDW